MKTKLERIAGINKESKKRIVIPKEGPEKNNKNVKEKLLNMRLNLDKNALVELTYYFSSGTHLLDKNPAKFISQYVRDKFIAKDVLEAISKLSIKKQKIDAPTKVPKLEEFDPSKDAYTLTEELAYRMFKKRPDGLPVPVIENIVMDIISDHDSVYANMIFNQYPILEKILNKFKVEFGGQISKLYKDN